MKQNYKKHLNTVKFHNVHLTKCETSVARLLLTRANYNFYVYDLAQSTMATILGVSRAQVNRSIQSLKTKLGLRVYSYYKETSIYNVSGFYQYCWQNLTQPIFGKLLSNVLPQQIIELIYKTTSPEKAATPAIYRACQQLQKTMLFYVSQLIDSLGTKHQKCYTRPPKNVTHYKCNLKNKKEKPKPKDVTQATWNQYQAQAKKNQFEPHTTTLNKMREHLQRQKMTLEDGLRLCIRHGWPLIKENFRNFGRNKQTQPQGTGQQKNQFSKVTDKSSTAAVGEFLPQIVRQSIQANERLFKRQLNQWQQQRA